MNVRHTPPGYPPVADLRRWLREIIGEIDQLTETVADLGKRLAAVEHQQQADAMDPEEWSANWEAESAERHQRNAVTWHATLWETYGSTPLDAFDAATIFNMTKGGARERLGHLTARGLATMAPRGPGQHRDLYTMHPIEEDSTDAATVA